MPLSPEDLPRSPSGRVPQWVIDERSAAGQDLPPLVTVRRRRRRPGLVIGVVAVLAAGTWWWTSGGPALPDGVTSSLEGLVQPAPPPPSAEVVALADAAHLSDEGRELLYRARTEILGADEFAGRCRGVGTLPRVRADGAVGCYLAETGSIIAYAPSDPRLRGFLVETVAHETLHAAWETLDPAEQTRLTALLESVVASLPADDTIHEQIAASVGSTTENRPTELFAYVGTQAWVAGGLDGQLEAAYSRFVSDRAALAAVHADWVAVLDGLTAEIQAASDALVAQEYANAEARATVSGETASLTFYRESYEAKRAEVASMSASDRQRLRLSWEWWDGTVLPMAPADETLAAAAALLARDEVDVPARDAAVAAAEAAAAAERVRVEAMLTELETLQRDLDPGAPAAQP
ncbi:hypothetical protein [Cellulomonas xylanilytica]|uniref:Aminopeptidase n=1 Tax=Cellulomonas xylanilytica TaxID=233583 RepID=A0A510V4H0_9CELL|nr:hypothetical protein [Cellulomonas xylanilytica]GEK21777.1 hypothetical protein CXY01_22970 [Cellulomonas xylanilytica]